jgi:hypothetical protein
MAVSVQGWRKKWFYIKDQKVSSSDQYGIAPFDASKEVKKRCTFGYSTHGVFPATSSSTPAASSFQTVDIFWLGRSFSSI